MSFASRNLFALLACHPSDRAYSVCMAEPTKVRIEFNVDNAAFEDDFEHELDLILKRAKRTLLFQKDKISSADRLRDSNGNTIGSVSLA